MSIIMKDPKKSRFRGFGSLRTAWDIFFIYSFPATFQMSVACWHMKKAVLLSEAETVAASIGIQWGAVEFNAEDFRYGMEVEYEHGTRDPQTNVTNDDPLITGRIAWAHLKEYPDYYRRLRVMEAEAEAYWASKKP